jgi:hypothetical protein
MFEFGTGTRDVVTVWDTDPETAAEAARNWLEFSQDLPTKDAVNVVVTDIGNESDPGDIGVAEVNEDVNHKRFSSEGEPVHTAYHGEPDEVHRLTAALRTSEDGNWPLIRSLLRRQDVEPSDAAVVGTWEWRPERPQQATVVTGAGHVYLFNDGSSPIDDPTQPPKLPPRLQRAPDSEDSMPEIELGLQMLREGST